MKRNHMGKNYFIPTKGPFYAKVLAFFSMAFYTTLCGEIITVKSIEDALPQIRKTYTDKPWVFIDLDDCLIQSATAFGHSNYFMVQVQKEIAQGHSKQEAIRTVYKNYWLRSQTLAEVEFLEKAFPAFIQDAQKKGVPTMGLTHRWPNVADITLRQLSHKGVDLNTTSLVAGRLELAPPPLWSLVSAGIIFVGDYSKKSWAIGELIRRKGQTPKFIVFIDDVKANVEDLAEFCQKEKIPYLGIIYRAIDRVPSAYQLRWAEIQEDYLKKHGILISNQEAEKMSKNSKWIPGESVAETSLRK